jgi:hypothetical protein
MRNHHLKIAVVVCCSSVISLSCNKEAVDSESITATQNTIAFAAAGKISQAGKSGLLNITFNKKATDIVVADNLYSAVLKKMVAVRVVKSAVPTACNTTAFFTQYNSYLSKFGPAEFDVYSLYAYINFTSLFLDNSKPYFGPRGEYTHLVTKQQRKLESFWNMPGEVRIVGEHNSTLNDRNKIVEVLTTFSNTSREEANARAGEMIAFNKQSPIFIETPLLSFDAFATGGFFSTGDFIALGDGIIQVLTESGVEAAVAVLGILAHEWAHQVQFNHAQQWNETAVITRFTELEADFFAGYYLTHKRGGTYNWKRVAEFLQLFYNIGDCGFEDLSHHGTPNQRLAASRLGYIIADETLPKGHILSADQLHRLYVASYYSIINNSMSTQQALASLKGAALKSIYKQVLKHKAELQDIATGTYNKARVANLQ